jgi:uncharacterized protein YkwD
VVLKVFGGVVALTATTALAAPAQAAGFPDEVVRLTNVERQVNGCADFVVHKSLTAAAQAHSQDMADHNFMGHNGSNGSSPWDRIIAAGYTKWTGLAENVAAGYQTPEAVVKGWMASPGHRANIVNCKLKEIGVGYAVNPNTTYRVYWTQDFGSRS